MHLTLALARQLDADTSERLSTIYHDSFPPEEREPFARLVQGAATGRLRLYLGRVGADVVGFAIVIPLPAADAHLLDYFAIARERRDQGLGSLFLEQLATILAGDGVRGIVLEVESDDDGTEAERALRRRRISFYRRNGLDLLPGVPPLAVPSTIDERLLETKLMWLPLRPAPPDVPALVTAVYQHAYGLPPDHPLVQQALNGVNSR